MERITKFLRYTWTSLAATIGELLIFEILLFLCRDMNDALAIVIANVIAKTLATCFSFNMNKKIVFDSRGDTRTEAFRFGFISLIKLFLSTVIIMIVCESLEIDETLAKVITDTALYFAFYYANKHYVYR